ncbi:hypothetical protein BBJ28_00013021 [Nothophytophthora sp. Chile5]|nr:hypothetical protein BBJ28_00013021 [Nothophytophthora sp. Chile5]
MGNTARKLINVAKEGNVGGVKQALLIGADMESTDENGWTSLLFAAWVGHKDVVELLLDQGASIDSQSNDGMTALHWAAHWDTWGLFGSF